MVNVTFLISILFPLFAPLAVYFARIKNNTYRKILYFSIVLITSLFNLVLLLYTPKDTLVVFNILTSMQISFALDGLGKIFFALVSFLWPFAMIYLFAYMEDVERLNSYTLLYVMTYGVVCGICLSSNMLTMFIFYELLTLITVPLISFNNTVESRKAGRIYLYISLAGSALAFMGLCYVLINAGNCEFVKGGIVQMQDHKIGSQLAFLAMFFGFGVKAAIFPLHFWLPQAGVAPTPTTALLHAVAVVKSGAFAIIRSIYYMIGTQVLVSTASHYIVLAFSAFTIIFGSFMAMKEAHFKRRLAYSTISNISYIVFAACTMTQLGLEAAMIHFVVHSISKIGLFYCCGMAMHKADVEYVEDCNGLGKYMKVAFICFTLCSLSLIGVPLFGGFISKWYIAQSAIESKNVVAYIGLIALILSAIFTSVYTLRISFRAFVLPQKPDLVVKENSKYEWMFMLVIIVMAILSIVLGVFSSPFINKIASLLGGNAL